MCIGKKELKSKQITLLIRPSAYKVIRQMGLEQDRSTNSVINWIIENWIKKHKEIKEE